MILRVAELFIGGSIYAEGQRLKPNDAWAAIDKNIDGLLAFFHALMTRDRVPLIDYEYTFPFDNFQHFLGSVAVLIHADRGVYEDVKKREQAKLASFQLRKLPS
jgi:hypothetical protein